MTSICKTLEKQKNAFSTYENLFNDINVLQGDKNALEIKIQVLKGEVSKQNEILEKNKLYFESIEFFKNKTIENTINKIKNILNNVKKRCEPVINVIKLIFKILITIVVLYILWMLFRNNIFKYIINFYTRNIFIIYLASIVLMLILSGIAIESSYDKYEDVKRTIGLFSIIYFFINQVILIIITFNYPNLII